MIDHKTCTKCNKSLPLTEFGKHGNGLRYWCKACNNEAGRQWKEANPEYNRQWHAENRVHAKEYARQWYAENRESLREYQRQARQDPVHGPKILARRAVNNEVEAGRFPPANTMVCEHCQEAQAAQWHHYLGYSEENALDVIALCYECHGKEHRL